MNQSSHFLQGHPTCATEPAPQKARVENRRKGKERGGKDDRHSDLHGRGVLTHPGPLRERPGAFPCQLLIPSRSPMTCPQKCVTRSHLAPAPLSQPLHGASVTNLYGMDKSPRNRLGCLRCVCRSVSYTHLTLPTTERV